MPQRAVPFGHCDLNHCFKSSHTWKPINTILVEALAFSVTKHWRNAISGNLDILNMGSIYI